MSRTKSFLSAVSIGYLNQALIMMTGLWLTPFLLHRVGQQEYGFWLVSLQFTFYLSLLDLGVVALLPRSIAYAIGRARGIEAASDLPEIIGQIVKLVLWQLPAVALLGVVLFWMIPAEWEPLRKPLGIIILGYAILFPFRILPAILQGLQDITFASAVAIIGWAVNTGLTVGLVLAGRGLQALAIGWLVQQIFTLLLCWIRIYTKFRGVLPKRLPLLTWQVARTSLSQGTWVSMAAVAQLLLNGTDVLIIGKLLGPEAVVPYACTNKLISVLATQPQMIMEKAIPALSELRTSGSPERLWQVMSALSMAMLSVSGLVACVVIATNKGFIAWWVGAGQYSGMGLTLFFLLAMLLRHWNGAWAFTLYCFGYERRLALTNLADGVVTVIAILIAVSMLGPIGAPLGTIFGVCVTSLPSNLLVVAREIKLPLRQLLLTIWPWAWRFSLLAAVSLLVAHYWVATSFLKLAITTLVGAIVYALVMVPMALQSSLAVYIRPLLTRLGLNPQLTLLQKSVS